MNGYRKYFTMSYDDGVIWDIPFLNIVNAYGIKATFNLNSGFLGTRCDLTQNGITFNHDKVNADQVRELYAGHEVATHSVTHPSLCRISDAEIVSQIVGDREALSALVGYDVRGHAYPVGRYDERVVRVLRDECGICYARTVDCLRTCSHGIRPATITTRICLRWPTRLSAQNRRTETCCSMSGAIPMNSISKTTGRI